jgi:uncharacterized membrane protein
VDALKERGRLPALDAARALGVAAMVAGHTLDALLAPSVRAQPALVAYWKARGFTAPVFIAVAGWAVTVAILRSGAHGWAIPAARWRRVVLLFTVGTLLVWPGWGLDALLAGDGGVFTHLVSFGVLHAIAASILATSVLYALLPERRARLLGLAALAVASVALGMRAPGGPTSHAGILLEQALGGSSPFPIFPWMAYFAVGAAVGLTVRSADLRTGLRLAGLGALLVGATCWTGVGTMPAAHPVLVVYRSGAFLLLLGLLFLVPAAAAARAAPLGRASLGVYAVHVPLVYGWSTHPGLAATIGQTLGVGQGLLVATGVLALALAARRAALEAVALARWALGGALDAAARVFGPLRSS